MFEQKVCVVTGGASGIGKGVCRRFSCEGAKVVIIDKNRNASEKLAEEIIETRKGAEVSVIEADVTKSEEVSKAFQFVEERYGGVDILVNCAGILMPHFITEIDEEEWDWVIAVNLKGTFLCVKAALLSMLRAQRKGKIINIASVAGKRGSGGWSGAHYAASKGGVIAFTKAVALQVAQYGINVNAVSPGPTMTPATEKMPAEMRDATVKSIPMGRLGTPEDVVNAVVFLATDASSYIQGEILNVNGGIFMD